MLFSEDKSAELVALDESLARLANIDPRQSRIVELRYFGGLTIEETAKILDVSAKTVKRDWTVAKAWLYGDLKAYFEKPPQPVPRRGTTLCHRDDRG